MRMCRYFVDDMPVVPLVFDLDKVLQGVVERCHRLPMVIRHGILYHELSLTRVRVDQIARGRAIGMVMCSSNWNGNKFSSLISREFITRALVCKEEVVATLQ